jgi:hypothetical protein
LETYGRKNNKKIDELRAAWQKNMDEHKKLEEMDQKRYHDLAKEVADFSRQNMDRLVTEYSFKQFWAGRPEVVAHFESKTHNNTHLHSTNRLKRLKQRVSSPVPSSSKAWPLGSQDDPVDLLEGMQEGGAYVNKGVFLKKNKKSS